MTGAEPKKRRPGERGKGKHTKQMARDKAAAMAERVAGEIVPSDTFPPGELPDFVPGKIQDLIESYCIQCDIEDLRKASAQEWSAVCMYVGRSLFRRSTILHDTARERAEGGTVYDAERVSALCDIWAALCARYAKPPLIFDFTYFSDVSRQYIYGDNYHSGELTSVSAGLRQKLLMYQEGGISSRLVDGRGSQVGQIFFLKNWHGWKDQREIVHTDGKTGDTAATLPVFDDVPVLPGENT